MENLSGTRDITLPSDIVNGSLTLDEIGTIVVLMGLHFSTEDYNWGNNETFKKNLNHFIEEGIVMVSLEDDSAEIDLTWI